MAPDFGLSFPLLKFRKHRCTRETRMSLAIGKSAFANRQENIKASDFIALKSVKGKRRYHKSQLFPYPADIYSLCKVSTVEISTPGYEFCYFTSAFSRIVVVYFGFLLKLRQRFGVLELLLFFLWRFYQ